MRLCMLAMFLLCSGAFTEPVLAQGARLQVPGGSAAKEVQSRWEHSTEIDHARATVTTRLSKSGRRLATGRRVVLQLTCYPHRQLEVSVVSPEYLTDHQQGNVKTDIRVRGDARAPLELEASLMGNYVVYLDHESSRRIVAEMSTADSLVVAIGRGAFDPYTVGFAAGNAQERAAVTTFCTG